MLSRLPKWVEYRAFMLALVAGSINSVVLLGFQHQAVSHLSETATLIGSAMLNPDSGVLLHLIGILLSFVMGSAISGFMLSGVSVTCGGQNTLATTYPWRCCTNNPSNGYIQI
ncbi:DUF1275 domain-containing protein [Marinomonas sp. RSW2]|uniref:DUF1275 domain-containing protein n=1 Tax=Marinomonas maritima TaxID=2940935 RepID=A0ABT5WEU3_9GAMM|nr:DUF1275 domain-containing protein [Marinomonas maritima]MDE8603333.1 DUF1275 domain-containing protein [Marinomonas maritima]